MKTPLRAPVGKKAGLAGVISLIIAAVFAVEGGFVDNPRDPGGATNHGVTEKVARHSGFKGRMQDLTRDEAEEIYATRYIVKPGFDRIAALDPRIAEEVVDTGVNAGPPRAARWFQESLNHLNRQGADFPDVEEDGIVGSGTIDAFEKLRRKRGAVPACQMLVKLLDAKQASHYMRLGGKNSDFETFMPGWIVNRIGNVGPDKCGTPL